MIVGAAAAAQVPAAARTKAAAAKTKEIKELKAELEAELEAKTKEIKELKAELKAAADSKMGSLQLLETLSTNEQRALSVGAFSNNCQTLSRIAVQLDDLSNEFDAIQKHPEIYCLHLNCNKKEFKETQERVLTKIQSVPEKVRKRSVVIDEFRKFQIEVPMGTPSRPVVCSLMMKGGGHTKFILDDDKRFTGYQPYTKFRNWKGEKPESRKYYNCSDEMVKSTNSISPQDSIYLGVFVNEREGLEALKRILCFPSFCYKKLALALVVKELEEQFKSCSGLLVDILTKFFEIK